MKKSDGMMEVFRIFHSPESYFDEKTKSQSNKLILNQILVICAFCILYGIVMGSYHSLLQALVAGIKLILLFVGTLLICFPSFFVIQQVLGSKMSLKQMLVIILSGFVLTSAIAFSFAPVVILFMITGGNYHFIQLLHVAIFLFSGFFGMRLMVIALKFACEKKNIYPRIGVSVFRIWIVILLFVSIQFAWNLRPFMCDKTEDFKLFRKYEGNFYTAIIYSIKQLSSPDDSADEKKTFMIPGTADEQVNDSTVIKRFMD